MQAEATYHCAHGETHFFNTILDWKPLEYYTIHQKIEGVTEFIQTRLLTPTETGTRLTFYTGRPPAGATEELREMVFAIIQEGTKGFKELIEADIASGKITLV